MSIMTVCALPEQRRLVIMPDFAVTGDIIQKISKRFGVVRGEL
jgi:hypothetical protein